MSETNKTGEKPSVFVDVKNTDWEELHNQRVAIFTMITSNKTLSEGDKDALAGVLSFLDHVQDEATETLGDDAVFGICPDPENDPDVTVFPKPRYDDHGDGA